MSNINQLSKLIYNGDFGKFIQDFDLTKDNLHKFNDELYTLLHIAAKEPQAVIVIQFLIAQGFNVDVLDDFKRTALFLAVNYNQVENAKALLAANASVDIIGDDQHLVLNIACAADHLDCVKLLLAHGADIDSKSIGISPLRDAIYHEASTELIHYLIDQGAAVDGIGHSIPLFAAIAIDNLSITKWLLVKGADHKKKNKQGETALDFAKRIGNTRMIEYLESL